MAATKFRAYDNTNKQWLLGYEYKNLGGFDMFGECVIFGEWASVAHEAVKGNIDVKIMLYSGLKDLSGKEIYEGDVVYLAGYGDYIAEFPFIQLYESSFEGDVGDIKGNIYENPEMNIFGGENEK